jgi:hypothetical protein
MLQVVVAPAAHQSGVFQNARLRESSGVTISRAHPGVLWTHNDSGDGPYVYASDTSGADRGALRVAGAYAEDWEDMTLGPCPRAAGDCLYFADTGDNAERRLSVTLYAVAEPVPPAGSGDTSGTTAEAAVLRVRYPDGPADVEAMYAAGDDVYLVTKGRSRGVRLYRVPRSAWGAGQEVVAEKVQDVPITPDGAIGRLITGAAAWNGGSRVAVRTYTEIYLFAAGRDGRLKLEALCFLGFLEPVGEAVAFLDAGTLVLTSEAARQQRGTIHIVRCS